MVDIKLLTESIPLSPQQFEELVRDGCSKSKEILSESWVFQCARIVNDRKDQLEQVMPNIEVHVLLYPLFLSVIIISIFYKSPPIYKYICAYRSYRD